VSNLDSKFLYGTEISSSVSKARSEYSENVMNVRNFISLVIYNSSSYSYSVPELEENVKQVLREKLSSDYNLTITSDSGTLSFFFDFYANFSVGKSVNYLQNETQASESPNLPFLELKTESDNFDVDFLNSCVNGCNLENYEKILESCLVELQGNKSYTFQPVYAEEPYSSGKINSSFLVYNNGSWISQNWKYLVRNGTFYLLSCD
jgi:hypothetical protein